MIPDFWPVITTGIVILIAIAASNRSLRREMSERITVVQREMGERIDGLSKRIDGLSERIDGVHRELGVRIDGLSERIDGVQRELGARIDGVQRELSARIDGLSERLADVRERLGGVEGLLEGIGYRQRKLAEKGRGNEKHDPAGPR